jgi:hypothetical protein
MSITYQTSSVDGLMTETWIGKISIADLRQHWTFLMQDDDALALRRTLIDLPASTLQVSGEELSSAVRELVLPHLKGRDWITAIVVNTLAQFRLSSSYQGCPAAYSHDVIFSTVEEARRWLLKQQRETT